MDAAAKPPWMGLRRLPQPDPPRHPTGSQLLLWLLLLLLLFLRLAAGAGPQALP
ncbi:16S rRNA (guanine(966)-N(2))-methyltransferase RsmD, partial [Mesorhizobium sp. M1C.F.Ca.ET.212.01.1.1]